MRKSLVLCFVLLLTLSAVGADAPRLLVALPDERSASTLRLEIHVDGNLFVDDVLTLRDDTRRGTFEFLERDATRVSRLAQLAASNRNATVRLSADGEVFRTVSLRDFLAGAALLAVAKPQISLPSAETVTFGMEAGPAAPAKAAPRPKANTTCEEGCQLDRQWCYQNTQECQFVRFCDTCDSQYTQCLNSCQQSNDDDGDDLANFADNCPNTFNPGQQDCDGDGTGDACDPFNGTSEIWTTWTTDYRIGPFEAGCENLWRWTYYDLYYHRTDHRRDTYCDGTVVYYSSNTYYVARQYGYEYDPWWCGPYAWSRDPGVDNVRPAAPSMPEVQFRDGQLWFGERAMPAPEGARFEERFGAIYVVRADGAWQLSLEPFPLDKAEPPTRRTPERRQQ